LNAFRGTLERSDGGQAMKERETYDDPTTGAGDPTHGEGPRPEEPVTTGSGDPQHKRSQEDLATKVTAK
jgi:hypothetical protein